MSAAVMASKLSRRHFLRLSATGLGAVAVTDLLVACGTVLGTDEDGAHIDISTLAVDPNWIEIRRPDDLLVVDIGLVNLKRQSINGVLHLVKKKATKPALLVARFPPQHLHEANSDAEPPFLPVQHELADHSRLVYNVGAQVPIELSIAGILEACLVSGLNVALGAQAVGNDLPDVGGSTSGVGGERDPDLLETSVELPYGLALSPNQTATFAHAVEPVASPRGRVELWNARLDARRDLRTMRALWNHAPQDPTPLVQGLEFQPNQLDRDDIVDVTSNPANPPIQVQQLSLSALGAWFDASLDVDPALGFGLRHWDHRAAMGRDVRVEIVTNGRLYPLCHAAPRITTVERRFTDGPNPIAYLHREERILCSQPVRACHGQPPPYDRDERQWPFASVRIVTRSTPVLDSPPARPADFLPHVGGTPFEWEIEATDRRGETVRFKMPLLWMPENRSQPRDSSWPTTTVPLHGQRVAFAAFADDTIGDREATTLETRSLTIDGVDYDPTEQWDGWFYPRVTQASVVVEALAASAGATAPVDVTFPTRYVDDAFTAANPSKLFLELAGGPLRADFVKAGTDKVGGFVTPNLDVAALSRITGPVTSAVAAATGAITRDDVFPLTNTLDAFCPKLFGCISLKDILSTTGVNLDNLAPKFVTEAFDEIQRLRQLGEMVTDPQRVTDLRDQLDLVIADTLRIAQDIRDHAEEIREFFDTAPDKFQATFRTALATIEGFLQRANPETITDPEIDEAFTNFVDAPLAQLQAMGQELAKDKTVVLIEHMGPFGTPMRTLRRAITGVTDVAEDTTAVTDVIKAALKGFVRARDIAKSKSVKIDWRPQLAPSWGSRDVAEILLRKPDGLLLSVELRAKQRGDQKAGADVLCSLEDFGLTLLNLIELDFKRLQFRQRMSQKPEIDVVFKGIEFIGPLSFVETLKDILPLDGFSDPPAVKVDAKGLDASFSLAIPNVAVGVFSMENMRIGARLLVPFLGDAISFRFEFSRRESPFLVTVAMFGGGGFFEIELTPKGLKSMIASIQFGAQLSASIGVASGSISFMGGVVYEMTPTEVTLSGFLRMRGECDILGLVSASLELYLALKYRNGKLSGVATLEIEISIAFFTLPVKITTERTFVGANGDPPFAAMVPFPAFEAYCDAFAA